MRNHGCIGRGLRLSLALLILAACAPPAPPAPVTLRVTGSSSMAPLLRDLAAAYSHSRPHVRIEVHGGDMVTGLEELRAGQADLAAVSWQPAEPPAGLHSVPIGRDAIAVIVHPRNAMPGLTLLQLRALYRGEVLDWRDLGGPEGEPIIISREDGSGTRAAFEAIVMGSDRVTLNALVMPGHAAVADYVASHRLAIGYVSMAALDARVRALPIEDARPTAEDVRSGAYHLSRSLYLYTLSPPTPAAQEFLAFVLSPAGQTIVGRHHISLR